MRERVRGTEIYFDTEGTGLVPEGNRVVKGSVHAVPIHGGLHHILVPVARTSSWRRP
jgi:hypothetical protein